MIKDRRRITRKLMEREVRRFREIAPVFKKAGISDFEEYVCNSAIAMVKTVEELKMKKETIEFALFLYQFEFFEYRWLTENYEAIFIAQKKHGKRRAANMFILFLDEGYIVDYKLKKGERMNPDDKYRQVHEISKNVTTTEEFYIGYKYTTTDKVTRVARAYFKHLTGITPSRLDKTKKRLIFKGQNPLDAVDYREF